MCFIHQLKDYIHTRHVHNCRQVMVTGQFLTSKAAKWYLSEVAAYVAEWTLHNFLKSLFNKSFQQDYRSVIRHRIDLCHQGHWKVRRYSTVLASRFALLPEETERTKVL